MSIQTIIFDMGNVLLEWNSDKILRSVESDADRQEQLRQAIFDSGIWHAIDAGQYTIEAAEQLACQQLEEDYHAAVHQIMWHWYRYVDVFDDVQNLALPLVSAGYQLYILSNTSSLFYRLVEESFLPIVEYVSGVVLSYEEQQMKPESEIYQTLLERYQLCPEKCLFIDDIAENIATARSLGMQGCIAQDVTAIVTCLEELIEAKKTKQERSEHSNGDN
ncbi:MAG: HAD family phosphatase [Aerococcaceae bacterium]|nr:HAD family phosphatase [Aerococcaceae bacterium]